MRVLYIGGTGEISYECVRASVSAGQEVTVFNRGRSAEPLLAEVRRIIGDVQDDAGYAPLGQEHFDVVCQFLAYRPETIRRDREVFGGKVGQYVFISTASAYQKPPRRVHVTEDVPLENPYWAYSRAKAQMERELTAWHAAGTLPVTIVRPSHTYRRRFPGTFARGDDWAWRMLNGRAIISHGDGTSLWMLTHSRDFATPFVRLLGNEKALGEAFHITTDQAEPWDSIFHAIGAALGVQPRLVHVPTETLVRYNAEWAGPLLGDKAWPVIFDNAKVRSVAGAFECTTPMAEGMKEVAARHYPARAAAYEPNEELHALLDRIAEEQLALGGGGRPGQGGASGKA